MAGAFACTVTGSRGVFRPVVAYRVTRQVRGPWAGWADSAAPIDHVVASQSHLCFTGRWIIRF